MRLSGQFIVRYAATAFLTFGKLLRREGKYQTDNSKYITDQGENAVTHSGFKKLSLSLLMVSATALSVAACGGGSSGASSGFGGSSSSSSSSSSSVATIIVPDLPASANVTLEVHSDEERATISPLIYGINGDLSNPRETHLTFNRGGGNRLTAYNWETNDSNAGTDYQNQNDSYLGGGTLPGGAWTPQIQTTLNAGGDYLMTIPSAGYVSADHNGGGDVNQTPDFIHTRFNVSLPRKGAPFTQTPDLTDGKVYQDEFVNYLKTTFPTAFSGAHARIGFSIDNEPDNWYAKHPRLRGSSTSADGAKITYAELFQRTEDFGSAIKDVAPNAYIYGPSLVGYAGFTNLQSASDASDSKYAGKDFLDAYLAEMRAYDVAHGRRLLDVLDFHWYPEAQSASGVRITGPEATDEVRLARTQAPRSLYDSTYTEKSWITQYIISHIDLIPNMRAKIAAQYPGTKVSFSEYDYGGGSDISGGVAEADVLGVFAREGVYAANFWPEQSDFSFILGGMDMFRNFNGSGAAYGDTNVKATTSDGANTAIYSSVDAANPGRMVVVIVNRGNASATTALRIWHTVRFSSAHVYRLEGAISTPQDKGTSTITGNSMNVTIPAYSVTTILLQ